MSIGVSAFAVFVSAVGAAELPPYIKPDSYTEKEIVVGKEPWALGATLSVPKGDGPWPAVVLVHGSGPHDRDETIFKTKPFRDIAGGLASRGIAVLRYEKRVKAHGAKAVAHFKEHPADISPEFEVIDDALAAAELLRATPGVDPKRIYLAGHSLGGGLAPAIAKRDGKLAGLVILAGNTRPSEDAIVEQLEYLQALPLGKLNVPDDLLAAVRKAAGMLRAGQWPSGAVLLGLPLEYWAKLNAATPDKVPEGLKSPMLILRGERDYQVTEKDFENWRKLTAGRTDVVLKPFPKLNHLFVEGEGKSGPAEYTKAGFVSADVIDSIAGWINGK